MKEQPKSRESGYYWVKIGGDWIIAQWAKSFWLLMGIYREDDDSDFEAIDERKISRVSVEPPKPELLEKALNDAFVAGRSKRTFADFKKEWTLNNLENENNNHIKS